MIIFEQMKTDRSAKEISQYKFKRKIPTKLSANYDQIANLKMNIYIHLGTILCFLWVGYVVTWFQKPYIKKRITFVTPNFFVPFPKLG